MSALLALDGVSAWYGEARVLFDVSLEVAAGEVVAVLGRNGAGKSSTLKSAMGLMPRVAGSVRFDGTELAGWPPFRRARAGLGYVPEERRIFTELTVAENLRIAARPGAFDEAALLDLFPNLREMLARPAAQMSGGEQQMLAVARALASNPRLVLLDEPSEGIAPLVVARLREAVLAMKSRGVAILLAEQNLGFVAACADRAVLIEQGYVRASVEPAELAAPGPALRRALGL
ncbi:MAG: ABC transporter ATP-binding protein [Betaproteobacteria bacterium]